MNVIQYFNVYITQKQNDHAGGHAAHFANIDQGSPMFSQERAPTSVAYAENQSMFLDSFIDDAAWKARYALSRYAVMLLKAICISAMHQFSNSPYKHAQNKPAWRDKTWAEHT